MAVFGSRSIEEQNAVRQDKLPEIARIGHACYVCHISPFSLILSPSNALAVVFFYSESDGQIEYLHLMP